MVLVGRNIQINFQVLFCPVDSRGSSDDSGIKILNPAELSDLTDYVRE